MQSRWSFILVLATACAENTGTRDPIDVGDCDSERFAMSGAMTVDTRSAATVLVESRIVGVGGFADSGAASYLFSAREALTAQLGNAGVYDVATTNLKFLLAPRDADCQVAGECSGLIARAGTLEVLATTPYRAQFALTDLYAYDGSDEQPTQIMAGEVTGCIASAD